MATFETTWRYMFENAIAGRDIEVFRNDTWEPLSYINNHWTDENGKLYNLPDTIYYVINGKAMAAHESWWVDWRYVTSTPAPTNNGLINAMVEASIEIQQKAHALAMQEKQESRRVHVYLNNCLPGEFRASELAKKLKVSPRTVGRVAKEYGLKSDNGWYLWTKAKPAANRVYDAFELLMEQAKPGSFFSVQDVAAIAQTDDETVLECARALGITFDAQNIHEYSTPAPTPHPDDNVNCPECETGVLGLMCPCKELQNLAAENATAQPDDTTNEGEIFYYEADQPCPVCGEYCKRSPSDCEEFGYDADNYEEDDSYDADGYAVCSHCGENYLNCTCDDDDIDDEYICWECGLPEDACICDDYEEDEEDAQVHFVFELVDDYDADSELMELAKATITANEAAQVESPANTAHESLEAIAVFFSKAEDLSTVENYIYLTSWVVNTVLGQMLLGESTPKPAQPDDTANEADTPCPVCGEYCKRTPSDCEEFGAPYIDYLPEDWQGYTEWALGEQLANRHAINELIGLVL